MTKAPLPPRLLLGPGPSAVHPRVLQAMARPLVGHLDPEFLDMMTALQDSLRRVFRTENRLTIAVSGTGSAGMEAALVNFIEPGDPVLVGINGVFGARMATIVERVGGKLIRVEAPWGRIIEPDRVREALRRSGPGTVVALVHAETSTGAHQPLAEIGAVCREHDALFVVDAVTSLGGVPVEVDRWQIDVCYSGTQKCLSCPPGLAPLTVNERARAVMRERRSPCPSWYLDLSLVADYWAAESRAYHHTAPVSMLFALQEALRLVEEEGLPARWARHRLNSAALLAGLAVLGLTPFAQDGFRLPTLNCMALPEQIAEAEVRASLLTGFGIEIGGGLGQLKGRIWRIGLMGESSTHANVLMLLQALEELLFQRGTISHCGPALEAAAQVYATAPSTAAADQV